MTEFEKKNIGVVKWFHDQQRDADYGFIQHSKLGDIYFNSKSIIEGQELEKFNENEVIVFEVRKSSRKKDSLEAHSVKLIKNENDIHFLFSEFLLLFSEKDVYSDYNLVQKNVFSSIQNLKKSTSEGINNELIKLFLDFIEGVSFTPAKARAIINLSKLLFQENYEKLTTLIFSKLDNETLFVFWLEGINEKINADYAAYKLKNTSNDSEISQIFYKCKRDEKLNLIVKLISDLKQIDELDKFNDAVKYLTYCKKYSDIDYEETINIVIENSLPNYKLNLWLDSFSEYYNFEEYINHVKDLTPDQQIIFFKKTIKLIHEGRSNLSVKDLSRIEGEKIDYTLIVIIHALNDLANEQVTKRETIFEIIAKQINNPNDLLQIRGFFDKCNGRCKAIVDEIKDAEGEIISKEVRYEVSDRKPRFAVYCDGRKAKTLCTNTGVEFWWCENNKCYKPSRELHNSQNWSQYSLWDLLHILNIRFREADYEILLNVINKVNRFLEHLKCRSCNEILRPAKKTNYSFWGVSDFHCTNDICDKKRDTIYISHCLNGKCEGIIDSRDSVKCSPESHADCGWYICNNCNACCNSPQLEKRKWVYENILSKAYPCHLIGHKDLGQICCNKCGSTMNDSEGLTSDFPKTLNWFIENKDTNTHIVKSGQRKDGKWWFTFAKKHLTVEEYRQKLNKLISIGFSIPDYEKIDKVLQLVAEPSTRVITAFSKVFTCSKCDHVIDLRSDVDRYNAMKNFHTKIFANGNIVDE